MYDIIFIGNNEPAFLKLREKFPTSKRVKVETNLLDSFNQAKKKAFTKMFWVVWDDIEVNPDFKFDYKVDLWNEQYNHLFLNGKIYDGIGLFSKQSKISNRELSCRFFTNKKEVEITASAPKAYDKFYINSYDEYLVALETTTTDMFWVIPNDVNISDDFKFDLYFDHHNQYDRQMNHVFLNDTSYDGIMLASKKKVISKREFDYRFLVEKKEWSIVASTPKHFDKFHINTYDEYLAALDTTTTEMLWIIPNDVIPLDAFKFDLYFDHHNQYDRQMNHVFLNDKSYDGIILASKKKVISKREFDYRFLVEKKEWNVVASLPKHFDKFHINTYDEYLAALENTTTEMFWVIPNDVIPEDTFKFDLYFDHHNQYDRQMNHVFLNDKSYDGIILASKKKTISKREFDYRFLVEKKEWDIVASTPKVYDRFYASTYDEYLAALENTTTEMFWVIPNDVTVLDDFKFDLYFDHHNQYDRQMNHVFLNGEFYDGVILASKKKTISKKEFDYRFLVEKKEWNIVASKPKMFEVFNLSSYDDYLNAINSETTNMFYGVFNDTVVNNFEFTYYVPKYNQHITHVFKNGKYYDGVCLFSKSSKISEREFNYRFFTNKKEVDIDASIPKPFDVVFISYFEKFADDNFQKMLDHLQPNQSAYRINGIKGIHQAHRCAAELVKTDMFWVVDADAILESNFKFDFPQVVSHDTYTKSIVHVWRSRNPINDLEYGYGGVKLLPRKLTLDMDMSKPDMTTSISASFKAMLEVSNVAGFNTDPFTTWRSAFRECVKLASKTIQGQEDRETEERLDVWCTVGADREYGEYAIAGAIAGRKYGQENAGDIPALSLINDYDWLKSQFEQTR